MDDIFELNQSWPDELKELSCRRYRAACRVANLENAVTHADPTAFDDVMDRLEAAQDELRTVGRAFMVARLGWESKQIVAASGAQHRDMLHGGSEETVDEKV